MNSEPFQFDIPSLIISAVLTWGIGLAPPLIIRYAVSGRALSKGVAIAIVVVFWLINVIIFTALGSQSRSHIALFFVAYVSYRILRAGFQAHRGKQKLREETRIIEREIVKVNVPNKPTESQLKDNVPDGLPTQSASSDLPGEVLEKENRQQSALGQRRISRVSSEPRRTGSDAIPLILAWIALTIQWFGIYGSVIEPESRFLILRELVYLPFSDKIGTLAYVLGFSFFAVAALVTVLLVRCGGKKKSGRITLIASIVTIIVIILFC